MYAVGRYEIRTENAPKALGPYNQAVGLAGARLLFVSGQIGIDPGNGELVGGGIRQQTKQCIRNIRAILGAAGDGAVSIVKTTIYLADIGDFPAMNEAYAETVEPPYPARSCVGGCELPKGALVEIEAIAVLEDKRHET
jgi:2-iminobutanoate/2-iminopropanoate deaminase